MDTATTVIAIMIIGAAVVGLLVLLALRDRRTRQQFSADSDHGREDLRERARAQHEGEAARGKAAGMAYGSGTGGNAP